MNFKLTTLIASVFLVACSQLEVGGTGDSATVTAEPEYGISQVVGNLYMAHSDGHNTLFLVTSGGTILADPLNLEFAEWLKGEIAERFDSTVRYVLYSHHHWDHASGGAVFADTAEFVGHENMLEALALPLPANYVPADTNGDGAIQRSEAGGGLALYFDRVDANGDGRVTGAEMNRDIVLPTITYSDVYPVYLGGKEVRMVYAGVNHSNDGSIMFFTDEATAFGVDWLLVNGFPRTLYGAGLDAWVDVTERMATLGVTHVIPGHGERGRLEDLKAYGQFFRDLRTALEEAQSAGMSREDFQNSISLPAYSAWPGYETSLPVLAGEAYDLALQP